MVELLRRFWNTTFHLERKFLRMVWHLFVPGYVAVEYFKGKHRRYPHPVQFFLVVMFFLLLYLSVKGSSKSSQINLMPIFREHSAEGIKAQLDLFDALRTNVDSLPAALRTPQTRYMVDSLLDFTARQQDMVGMQKDSFTVINIDSYCKVQIASRDAVNMEPDSLVQYYHIKGFWLPLLTKQIIKSGRDGHGLFRFFIGNITWTILSLITLMAWLLHALFRRPRRLYVEHFVLLLLHHAGFFFLLTIISSLRKAIHLNSDGALIAVAWFILGFLWAFKRYYGQGWGRTIWKWLVFGFFYMFFFFLIFLLSFAVNLLLF